MSKLCLLFAVVLVFQASRACDDNNDEQQTARQDSIDYLANVYGFASNPWSSQYYSQPSRLPEYFNPYEGRTPFNKQQPSTNPFKNFFNKNNVDDESNNQAEGRFGLSQLSASILNAGLFNNRFTSGSTVRPFAGLVNRLPISLNPNYVSPISTFDSCTSPSGEAGICSPGSVCSLFGGRPSGSCLLGGVCCINAVTTCGGSVTLNNTFWQSPTTAVSSPSTCALTVKLDTKFVEQKKPICQVRLDFVSFGIAQPADLTSICSTDSFQVSGATNKVPTICGDNNGQHMYLEVPSSATKATDLQLMFTFGSGTVTRSWNIKIAMLPCGASYLAPSDCLQYFTAATGKVISFNWKDVAGTTTRQLANQDYNICFRTALIDSQKATQMCYSVCTTTNGGDAFSITGQTSTAVSAATAAICANDFLLIASAKDTTNTADRFCGGSLNPDPAAAGNAASSTICTTIKPFRIIYQTDGVEPAAAVAPLTIDTGNVGFCLDFQEKVM